MSKKCCGNCIYRMNFARPKECTERIEHMIKVRVVCGETMKEKYIWDGEKCRKFKDFEKHCRCCSTKLEKGQIYLCENHKKSIGKDEDVIGRTDISKEQYFIDKKC